MKPVLNLSELEFHPWGHGEKYAAKIGAIAPRIGAQKLGYNVTVLPPGKRAFPFHAHRINEEMFFILEGEGELRIGAERHPIRTGDFIACPAGGPERAHQIINTSETRELKYLGVATRLSPDIAEYPDSGKTGIGAEVTGPDGKPQVLRWIVRGQATLDDYWQGE